MTGARKLGELLPRELAMRALLIVQAAPPSCKLVSDYAELISRRYPMGRATAFRYARTAMDVLGIPDLDPEYAGQLRGEKSQAGWFNSIVQGYPRGRPRSDAKEARA